VPIRVASPRSVSGSFDASIICPHHGSVASSERAGHASVMELFSRHPIFALVPGGETIKTYVWDGDRRHSAIESQGLGVANFLLLREPSNKADSHAVQLHNQIGPVAYLPRTEARRMAKILDATRTPLYIRGTVLPEHGNKAVYATLAKTREMNSWLKNNRSL